MPETKKKWDGSPWQHPGGAGGESYYSGYGGRSEQKYHFQKGAHGKFDEFGSTEYLPEGGIAPFAQHEAERIMMRKKAALQESAQQIRQQGYDLLGSYRPGGLAQMQSGNLERMAGSQERYGEGLETPDLMYQHTRDRARRQRRQARKAARVGAISKLVGTITGGMIGGSMGAQAGGQIGSDAGAVIDPWAASQQQQNGPPVGPGGARMPGPDTGAPRGPMDSGQGPQAKTSGSQLQQQPGGQPGENKGIYQGPGQGGDPGGDPTAPGGAPRDPGAPQGPLSQVSDPMGGGLGGGLPMGGGMGGGSSVFGGMGQEAYAAAPMDAIAAGSMFDGEQLLDVALEEEPRLFGSTWNDFMFDRLAQLAGDAVGNEFWDDDEDIGEA